MRLCTCRFSFPSWDLAVYIFMNTTREIRNSCWDEIFHTYYNTLLSTVKRLGATEKGKKEKKEQKSQLIS